MFFQGTERGEVAPGLERHGPRRGRNEDDCSHGLDDAGRCGTLKQRQAGLRWNQLDTAKEDLVEGPEVSEATVRESESLQVWE